MTSLAEILKALPPDALLSAGQLLAIVEAAKQGSPEPAKEQNYSQWDDQRYIDEKTLADWIGEAVPTVKSWRSKGSGPQYLSNPKNVRYQVGHVREWLKKRTVANTSEASVKGLRSYLVEGSTAFPVFTYPDGLKLSLEASIKHEEDDSETCGGGFRIVNMGDAWAEHKDLYDALLSKPEGAKAILEKPSVAKNFDVAYWLFVQFIGGRLNNFQPLLKAIRLLVEHGTDINAQNNMTGYNLAHVLAINEEGFINENDLYNFMNELLDMGMDVDLMNHESISGRDIAEQNDTSPSSSNFLKVLNKRDFASSLEAKLSKKTK